MAYMFLTTEEKIAKTIKSIKAITAARPNGVSTGVLKSLTEIIAPTYKRFWPDILIILFLKVYGNHLRAHHQLSYIQHCQIAGVNYKKQNKNITYPITITIRFVSTQDRKGKVVFAINASIEVTVLVSHGENC